MRSVSKLFNRRGKPLFKPRKAEFTSLMGKLKKVHVEVGGKITNENELLAKETAGLTRFDAYKILIVRKIQITRNHIHELKTGKVRGLDPTIRRKQEIRKMIKLLWRDFSALEKIQTKYSKKKKGDPKLLRSMQEDVTLIERHLKEVEYLSKWKYESKRKNKPSKRRSRSNDIMLSEIVEIEEKEDYSDEEEIEIEYPEHSDLPAIDITQAMVKVRRKKDLLKQELTKLSGKLDVLKQNALDIGDELDSQEKVLDDTNNKVEKATVDMKKVNKSAKKAKKGMSVQKKILIYIALGIIGTVTCGVLLFVFLQYGGFLLL